jgi:hypothetical protein
MGPLSWLLPNPQAIRFYIMHKVKGQYQVLYTGKIDPTKEHFAYKGHTYHIDVSRVIEDAAGNQSLRYNLNTFEPLIDTGIPGVLDSKDLALEAQGSADSYMTLNRGIVKTVVGAVHAAGSIGLVFLLAACALTGAAGYFAGSDFPIQQFVGGHTNSLVTYVTGNHTVTTQPAGSAATTVTIQTPITIPQYLPPETRTATVLSYTTQTATSYYATPTVVTSISTTTIATGSGGTVTTTTITVTNGSGVNTVTVTSTTVITFNLYQTTTTKNQTVTVTTHT